MTAAPTDGLGRAWDRLWDRAGSTAIPKGVHRRLTGRAAYRRGMPSDEELRVLVVDDEPSISDLVATVLRYEGFRVEVAATGGRALRAAAEFDPALIVLDLMLPDLDGFEVHRRLTSFDWSFAAVSHPLLDLGGWLHTIAETDARRHVTAYLDGWRHVAPPGTLQRAWQVARPVAALSELVKFADLAERMGPAYEFDYLPMAYRWARRIENAFDGKGEPMVGWSDPAR